MNLARGALIAFGVVMVVTVVGAFLDGLTRADASPFIEVRK